jgi:sugar lactone lactonase YvrE
LLSAVSVAPVFADEPSEAPSEPAGFTPPTPKEKEVAAAQVPDARDVSKALGEFEREEAEHEEWLASPEAKEQREDTQFVFGDISAGESEELLRSVFSEQLEALNSDPSRFLSDAQLVRPLGESGAVVKDDGEGSLLETTVPVRTEDEEGQLAKVDLSLEATSEGFQTENAISDLILPSSADEPIQVGEEGVEVAQGGAVDSPANRFGDKNLFYPSVLPDTDLLVAGNSFGAEIFDLLRSKDSPEDLRFEIGLPEGAELRSDEHGGAEVTREGERLTLIPKPYALDAQGTEIPVQIEVEGTSIVVHVAHREREYAYPALLDPIVEDWVNQGNNWYGGNNWASLSNGAWQWTRNNSNIGQPPEEPWKWETCCWEGSHAGLLINMRAAFYGPEQFGQWSYSTGNEKVYITHVWLTPFNRKDEGCGSAQPHDYAGLWQPAGWWNPIWLNYAKNYGNLSGDGNGQALVIGEGSGPPGVWLACDRILYTGGVGIWLDDQWGPGFTSVSNVPSGWIKKDATQRTINVSAWDEGLGVRRVRMISPGGKEWNWNQPSCTGLYGNRCPTSASGQITYETGGFPFEGKVPIGIQAFDPTEKSGVQNYELLVDGTSPTINLSGQLAGITEEKGEKEKPQGEGKDELSLPTYKMEIEAKDGSPTELRSGVKEIKVYLDNKQTPEQTEKSSGCPAGSCPLTMNYTLKTVGLSQGTHTLKIVAVDWAGNEVKPERKVEFEYIPATGMKEEYVLQHIPLPDGHDHSGEDEPHGPEIAVNVMNGNLVYHERDFDVQAPRATLELERVYNSQLPTEKDTQWGHGWSVAQTPELKPQQGESPPQKATMTQTSAITNAVNVPTSESQTTFSSRLHAEIDKTGSGYEVAYKGGAEVALFNAGGRIEETRYGDNSPLTLGPPEPPPAGPPTSPTSFGSSGAGSGQFAHPAGIAQLPSGNLWVVDENNKRLQKFNEAGEYKFKFGSAGSGNGQLNRPTDVALDAKENLWVTDAGNTRVQEFNSGGEYVRKFGSAGTGNGQFGANGPEALAVDGKGNVWVTDTVNGRLQKFNEKGEFVKAISSNGSGAGQLGKPTGIDIGLNGNVWVADWQYNRVVEFNEAGEYVRQFGAEGTGNGQFKHPDTIEVDSEGDVWVLDEGNGRVQEFTETGEYISQFGTAGTGAGQFSFSYPAGLLTNGKGGIWVSDPGNNRVQKWVTSTYRVAGAGTVIHPSVPVLDYSYTGSNLTGLELKDPASDSDPSLDINVSSGLVSSAEGEGAEPVLYGYSSGRLITKLSNEGQAKYTNDSSGRLKRIELPNGTWAEIAYDSLSRATAVTVDPAGAEPAKTTHFWYGEEPRETKVWGGGEPEITYSIGEDGSVFKWAWAEVPPAIDSISGSLWGNRNSTTPIENKDHTLVVTGSSPHEIGKVQILVNGTSVVAEKTCEDTSVPPDHHCEHVKLEWITNAAEHAPGQLNLEVVVTDFLDHSVAERFFVTIPQQPPPNPEAPERPSFASTKLFREEYGLDRNKNLTEEQLNHLILELLFEWELQQAPQVKAVEKWGIPMRTPEIEEMEFRERYISQAAQVIPEWAEDHAWSTYGGYYVDNRAGGKIFVGFTSNQQSTVEALKSSAGLIAPQNVAEFVQPPTTPITSLEATEDSVVNTISANEAAYNATTGIEFNPESNLVEVGATNQALVSSVLTSAFGSNAPIRVYTDELPVTPALSRYKSSGAINGGDDLQNPIKRCTAGFSARDKIDEKQGQPVYAFFVLTAGHCFADNSTVSRVSERYSSKLLPISKVARYSYGVSGQLAPVTDSEGIRIDPGLRSGSVFIGSSSPYPMLGVERPKIGMTVCWSGVNGGTNCGQLYRRRWIRLEGRLEAVASVSGPITAGDSGGPVWDPYTQKAVGLITFNRPAVNKPCHNLKDEERWCPRGGFTPLMPFPRRQHPIGVQAALGVAVIKGD